MKNYKTIIEEKGWGKFPHQESFLNNDLFYEPNKPIILAVGTGGGKTFTTLMKLDIWYSNPLNKGKKTIIFSHATNVLKDNFRKSLEEKYGEKSFSHYIIKDSSEIETIFNSDYEVIIMLPQTIKNHLDKIPNVEWMVVDEAHEWYGENVYNEIIDILKPKYQLLLTGTPSKFNNQPDKFLYYHTSVDELRKLGKLGNANINIISSTYDLKGDDILNSENVHSRVTSNEKQTTSSLYNVCKQMLFTLNGKYDSSSKKGIEVLFNTLKKTIIFCRTQKQANHFYSILNKRMKGKVIKSLSEDGNDSSQFNDFEQIDNIKVLILVRKGRLGFDMDKLYNIVDFTLSVNVDNISQMLGRILRPDSEGNLKNYFKVCPHNAVWYYEAIMRVVLRLTMKDAYVEYNGNQNAIVIPKPEYENINNEVEQIENINNEVEQIENIDEEVDFDDLDSIVSPNTREEIIPNMSNIDPPSLIMDLNFFKKYENEINDGGLFKVESWCTLDDVRKEVLGLRDRKTERSYEECLDTAKKWTRKGDWQKFDVATYEVARKMGWLEKIVEEANLTTRKLVLTKEECKECADQCSTRTEFARRFQPKYSRAKNMGWLNEWFPEIQKSGPKVGIKVNTNNKNNMVLVNKQK